MEELRASEHGRLSKVSEYEQFMRLNDPEDIDEDEPWYIVSVVWLNDWIHYIKGRR
jgi:hypothetical protein